MPMMRWSVREERRRGRVWDRGRFRLAGLESWLHRLFFCGEPCGEFVGREDAEVGVHAVVAEAADLGAEDGVGSGSRRA